MIFYEGNQFTNRVNVTFLLFLLLRIGTYLSNISISTDYILLYKKFIKDTVSDFTPTPPMCG